MDSLKPEGDLNMPPQMYHYGISTALSWIQIRNRKYRKSSLSSTYLSKSRTKLCYYEGFPPYPLPYQKEKLPLSLETESQHQVGFTQTNLTKITLIFY